jgi:glycosyltransferase involved in cell wall biosynthesis
MESMRVAMISYYHYSIDARVRRAAEALVRRGDEVDVYCPRDDGEAGEEMSCGVRVCRIAGAKYRGGRAADYVRSHARFCAGAALRLARRHVAAPYRVVHVHTMPDYLILAAIFPKLAGAKVLLHVHDLMPHLFALKFGLGRHHPFVKLLQAQEVWAAGIADALVTVHEGVADLLVKHGVPREKITVILNAPDETFSRPADPPPPDRTGIRLVYHGTILQRYGVDLAVEAVAEARTSLPGLTFEMYGDGDFVEEVRARIATLSAGDYIRLTGKYIPIDRMPAALHGADIGLVPNRDDDECSLLPMKLLEYFALGVPVVAACTRCLAALLDEDMASFFPPGDSHAMAGAIRRLALDPERRAVQVAAGRRFLASHGWERQKEVLFALYDRLVG